MDFIKTDGTVTMTAKQYSFPMPEGWDNMDENTRNDVWEVCKGQVINDLGSDIYGARLTYNQWLAKELGRLLIMIGFQPFGVFIGALIP